MYNPESIKENETQQILGDFEVPTDHLILARRPDLIEDFTVPADDKVKLKEREKKDK